MARRHHRGGGNRHPYPDESLAYRRRYDQFGDREYGLPERVDQIEMWHTDRALKSGFYSKPDESDIRREEWPQVGVFAIPSPNNFFTQAALVTENGGLLSFNRENFLFDRIVAEKAGRADMFDPAHPDYARYAAARFNLAVIRNWIVGELFSDDGTFDRMDESRIMGIAQELGKGLSREQSLTRFFTPALHAELLNVEGVGALDAYRFILERQRPEGGLFTEVMDDLFRMVGLPRRHFLMPPAEATPFTPENLGIHPARAEEREEVLIPSPVAERWQANRQSADSLSSDDRREAAMHGKIILDFFRNLKLTGKDMQEAMETGEPETQAQLLKKLEGLLEQYDARMEKALAQNPALGRQKSVQEAEDAAEEMEHAITLLAEMVKPVALSQAQAISADVEQSDHLHQQDKHNIGRICERLADKAEQAFGEIQAEEHQKEQAEQQDRLAELQLHAESITHGHGKRRRRRRRTSSAAKSGSMGASAKGFAQRRNAGDINGDGVADSEQRLTPQAKTPIVVPVAPNIQDVRFKDLDGQLSREARALAGALAGSIKMADVKADDRIRPDDSQLSAQEQLKAQAKRELERNSKKTV